MTVKIILSRDVMALFPGLGRVCITMVLVCLAEEGSIGVKILR
jgi:hypothetical protein